MQNITHTLQTNKLPASKKKETVACIWRQAFTVLSVLNTLCDTFLLGLCLDMDMMRHRNVICNLASVPEVPPHHIQS